MNKKTLIIAVCTLGLVLFAGGCTDTPNTNIANDNSPAEATGADLNSADGSGVDSNNNTVNQTSSREVWVYYYSTAKSTSDPDTAVSCDDIGIDYTTRTVTGTEIEQIKQAFTYLFDPEFTTDEFERGLNARPFNNQTLEIQTLTLSEDGILDISFENNDILKSLLHCDGNLFVNTIIRLARQFDSIQRVRFPNSFDIDM